MSILLFLINLFFNKSVKNTSLDLDNQEGVNTCLLLLFIDFAVFVSLMYMF